MDLSLLSNPVFHDQVLALCCAEGFVPRVVMEGADIETQLGPFDWTDRRPRR